MHSHQIRLQICLDAPYTQFKGVGADVEPANLSGHVLLYLSEETSVKQISLSFKGKATLPVDPDTVSFSRTTTHTFFSHDWHFLEGDQRHSRTLRAGCHNFPFQLQLPPSLPSAISTVIPDDAVISYKLHAQVQRPGLSHDVHATAPVTIIRALGQESLEYQQTLDMEGTWAEKAIYSFTVPHKAWAVGDHLTTVMKLSPLRKGLRIVKIVSTIREHTRYHHSSSQEHVSVVSMAQHEVINGRVIRIGHSDPSGSTTSPNSANASSSRSSTHSTTRDPSSQFTTLDSDTPTMGTVQLPSLDPPLLEELDFTDDIIAALCIPIPPQTTPSHSLEPIIVTHRIQWSIYVQNPDGHISELRCSLPLHVLNPRLLEESKRLTAPIRRMVLGEVDGPVQNTEDLIPPSYTAHVRDPLINLYLTPPNRGPATAASAQCRRVRAELPNYELAARCAIGAIPPLESMRGLPSYEVAQRL